MVRVQMLAELDEIIEYKRFSGYPDSQQVIHKTWAKRLIGCQRNLDVWQRILNVRALVISPVEDMQMWIKFASLCRKSGRPGLSMKIFSTLLSGDPAEPTVLRQGPPSVVYAYLKHVWASGSKPQAFRMMREFTGTLTRSLEHSVRAAGFIDESKMQSDAETNKKLLARCHLMLGDWQNSLDESWKEETITDILHNYAAATRYDRQWYKAWHGWALANYQVVSLYEKANDDKPIPYAKVIGHVVPAVQGKNANYYLYFFFENEMHFCRILQINCTIKGKFIARYTTIAHALVPVCSSIRCLCCHW